MEPMLCQTSADEQKALGLSSGDQEWDYDGTEEAPLYRFASKRLSCTTLTALMTLPDRGQTLLKALCRDAGKLIYCM